MNLDNNLEGKTKNSKDILSILESDELDFEFKPVTSGLGFNQEDDQEKLIKQKAKQRLQQKKKIAESTIQRGDLTPFYSDVKETPKPTMEASLEKLISPHENEAITPAVKLTSVETVEAEIAYRFVAHIIDLVLVFALTALTFGIFSFIANLNLEQLSEIKNLVQFRIAASIIFASYYVFYFTFLDSTKGSTIGKSIVDIRVVSVNDERANIIKTFFKSLLTLINYLLIGLLSFSKITDKLSGTKTIENGTF